MPDPSPAPRATETSAPSALNFFTVSDVPATRASAGSNSAAIAILIRLQPAVSDFVDDESYGGSVSILQIRLRSLHQLIEPRLVRIARFAGVYDRDLAILRGFHKLTIGSGIRIDDGCLFVGVVAKHLVVDLCALVATRASGRLDIGLVRWPFRRRFGSGGRSSNRSRRRNCRAGRLFLGDGGRARLLRPNFPFLFDKPGRMRVMNAAELLQAAPSLDATARFPHQRIVDDHFLQPIVAVNHQQAR